jgi:hypothetical protein
MSSPTLFHSGREEVKNISQLEAAAVTFASVQGQLSDVEYVIEARSAIKENLLPAAFCMQLFTQHTAQGHPAQVSRTIWSQQ